MEGGQGDHLACHILANLFLEFVNWKLLDDIFSSYMFHVQINKLAIIFRDADILHSTYFDPLKQF